MRSAIRWLVILALVSAAVVRPAHATDRAGRKTFQAAWVGQSVDCQSSSVATASPG
jgi:hypothetical protein